MASHSSSLRTPYGRNAPQHFLDPSVHLVHERKQSIVDAAIHARVPTPDSFWHPLLHQYWTLILNYRRHWYTWYDDPETLVTSEQAETVAKQTQSAQDRATLIVKTMEERGLLKPTHEARAIIAWKETDFIPGTMAIPASRYYSHRHSTLPTGDTLMRLQIGAKRAGQATEGDKQERGREARSLQGGRVNFRDSFTPSPGHSLRDFHSHNRHSAGPVRTNVYKVRSNTNHLTSTLIHTHDHGFALPSPTRDGDGDYNSDDDHLETFLSRYEPRIHARIPTVVENWHPLIQDYWALINSHRRMLELYRRPATFEQAEAAEEILRPFKERALELVEAIEQLDLLNPVNEALQAPGGVDNATESPATHQLSPNKPLLSPIRSAPVEDMSRWALLEFCVLFYVALSHTFLYDWGAREHMYLAFVIWDSRFFGATGFLAVMAPKVLNYMYLKWGWNGVLVTVGWFLASSVVSRLVERLVKRKEEKSKEESVTEKMEEATEEMEEDSENEVGGDDTEKIEEDMESKEEAKEVGGDEREKKGEEEVQESGDA
ncbi:hypothetical protein M011DRAFT_457250 [Sporormia fimetaria CBS 119925]|uniref:Uncharacterized protein n=1 Tax=Sporormia fimetaria CBS 119925 TaxID=1340428 RepID=A0A6A6VJ83_9PLEO|nr:hypothetical protein M011DRAFT_457250 [Sporormia fimetaria CBS 119925]